MDGVLNQVTNTVHKQATGESDLHTVCGVTYHLSRENLTTVTGVESRVEATNTDKCGRCFGGGSY